MSTNDLPFWLAIGVVAFFVVRMVLASRHRISGAVAREKVAKGALLLDVRSPGEVAGGALPDAKNIPLQQLGARLSELPKDRAIVVYCASGMRSASARALLAQHGFEVYDLGPGSRW